MERPVYPGHALPTAIIVMKTYGSFSEATKISEHGWPDCLGHINIPGAGDGVYDAVDLLKRLKGSDRSPQFLQESIKWSHDQWRRRVGPGSGNHEHAFSPGLAQAKGLEDMFQETVASWCWE